MMELVELKCIYAPSTGLVRGNIYLGYKVDGGYRIPTPKDKIGIFYSDTRFEVVSIPKDGVSHER